MERWLWLLWLSVFALLSGCASVSDESKRSTYGDKSTWQAVRFGGVVRQELDFSCGLSSIATVLRHHYGDDEATERALLSEFVAMLSEEELSEVFARGASMAQLGDLFTKRGYVTRNWRVEVEKLRQLTVSLPAIVYLEKPGFRHFAVVRGVSEYQVLLADSARGNLRLSLPVFISEWKGNRALFIAKDGNDLNNALLAIPNAKDAQARAEMVRLIVMNPVR